MCSQGGCDTVDKFASCNLGQVPARLAMTWPDYPYRKDLAKLMAGASTDSDTREDLFKVDSFWAELTNELQDVSDQDVLQYLGNKLPSYQRLYNDNWLVRRRDAWSVDDVSTRLSFLCRVHPFNHRAWVTWVWSVT